MKLTIETNYETKTIELEELDFLLLINASEYASLYWNNKWKRTKKSNEKANALNYEKLSEKLLNSITK